MRDISLSPVMLLIIILITIIITFTSTSLFYDPLLVRGVELKVSNESNSMGVTVDSWDTVRGIDIADDNYKLYEGHIYVYKKNQTRIIHRLIKCLDPDCNESVFSGDANRIGELVNKSQISYRVSSINFN